jgi:hypothetical protein
LGGTVTHAKDRFHPPSLLLIQLGSNDLTEIKTVELVNNITSDILRIKLLFPNAEVIWSEIPITTILNPSPLFLNYSGGNK